MFPNYPCRRLEHKRAPFAAPEDVHYSIQQSYQPEIASGEIAMPICWVFVFHQRRRQTQCVCMYECVCECVCVCVSTLCFIVVGLYFRWVLFGSTYEKQIRGRKRERKRRWQVKKLRSVFEKINEFSNFFNAFFPLYCRCRCIVNVFALVKNIMTIVKPDFCDGIKC